MKSASRKWLAIGPAVVVAAALVAGACTLDKQTAPDVTGPSELSLSVTMTATPDQLPRNGTAQSVVTVVARDANGKALAGQRFAVGVSGASGATLSAASVTTDGNGVATFAVGAPPPESSGTTLTVSAVPIGTNAENGFPHTVSIGLLGSSNTSAAAFTWTPATVRVGATVFFNATNNVGPSGAPITSYAWDFGDGSTGSAGATSHVFAATGNYTVRLTITDSSGLSATTAQNVSVQ